MTSHETFMRRCLQLAAQGLGNVAPNPMVGSVIVHNGEIIGEGYHQQYGQAHAEVNAINSVMHKELLKQSILHVNLEPCSHFGKTPPCADLIIENKILRVVIGSYDPNPLVAGKGIEKLKNAGVEVITEVLKKDADFLNRRFITYHTKQRPYIILKWAQSADGFMALNEPMQFWFSNEKSKSLMHRWRTEEPGILVGKNTVTVDDCELTARLWPGKNPTRLVIDKSLQLSTDKKVFNGQAPTLIFNAIENKTIGANQFIKLDFNQPVISQLLNQLYHHKIQSVIIEGGPTTLNQFVEQNIWDEARIFLTPHRLKNGKTAPIIKGQIIEQTELDNDILRIYTNPSV
jgi:diaminohydroxyphosphoribosylaminopyrimidine deaminase/5-amino-6-(5-phosphoribosylamino)uracil reductase